MGIDTNARVRLQNRQMQTQLQNGLAQVANAVQEKNSNQFVIERLIAQINQLNQSLQVQMSDQLKTLTAALQKGDLKTEEFESLRKMVNEINDKVAVFSDIKEKLDSGQTFIFPKETQLSGKVNVGNVDALPPIKVSNLADIKIPAVPPFPAFPKQMSVTDLPPITVSNLQEIVSKLENLQIALVAAIRLAQTKFPDSFKVKDEVKISQFEELLDAMEELKKGFNILVNKDVATVGFPDKEIPVVVTNFKYPAPVTHISLNSLKGPNLSTAVSVGTTATPLPATPLQYRRSVTIYNNGASTLFIGGANVTVANGMPVPAGTYAPSFDSGVASIVYGISASGSLDIRVLESSDYDMGF